MKIEEAREDFVKVEYRGKIKDVDFEKNVVTFDDELFFYANNTRIFTWRKQEINEVRLIKLKAKNTSEILSVTISGYEEMDKR